jgi:hypothetical protein
MIIFSGTKKIGVNSFMIFCNENGSSIDIPVDEKTMMLFLHHFERVSPKKPVEGNGGDGSE